MNPKWSARLLNKFVDADYAVKPFPDWVEIVYKRHWSVYYRWYGL